MISCHVARRRPSDRRRSGSAGRASRARRPPSRTCGRTGRSRGSGSGLNSAAHADVARLPGHAAIARLEDADGRDPDPGPVPGRSGGGRSCGGSARRRPGARSGGSGGSVRPSTCGHVAPPSSLRNRPAGSTPAKMRAVGRRRQAPDRRDRRRRRRRRSARGRMRPGRSRRRRCARRPARTTGCRRAARIAPLAGLDDRSWIGQPSHNGPRSDQSRRASSLSRMKAPFSCRRAAGLGHRHRCTPVVAAARSVAGPRAALDPQFRRP